MFPESPAHTRRHKPHRGGRVKRTGAQGLADLEPIVSEVADLEDGRSQEERQQHSCRAGQNDVSVELRLWRCEGDRPRELYVVQEAFGALEGDVDVEARDADTVPDGPQAVQMTAEAGLLAAAGTSVVTRGSSLVVLQGLGGRRTGGCDLDFLPILGGGGRLLVGHQASTE